MATSAAAFRREPTNADMRRYEGLVRSTAQLLVQQLATRGHVEVEFDDICQLLRMKVWRALRTFDPRRKDERRWVFMCVRDQSKDILNRKRRGDAYLEDMLYDGDGAIDSAGPDFYFFSVQRHLEVRRDEVYGDIEDDDLVIPSTLTPFERVVLVMLYREHKQAEIARMVGVEKREVEKAVRGIRQKMADWRPDADPAPERIAA